MLLEPLAWFLLGSIPAAVDEIDDIRSSVLGVGDLDGDGIPDFVLASRDGTEASPSLPSTIWALSGCDGDEIFRTAAPQGDPEFGRALAGAGDLDKDGFVDFFVAGTGCVYAVTTFDGGTLFSISSPEPGYDTFGHAIAGGHDLNVDGFPDLVVSSASIAYHESPPIHLFAGPAGAVLGCLEPDRRVDKGSGDWRQPYGQGLTLLPDLDGDGGGEIAISVQRGIKGCKEVQGNAPRGYIDVRTAEGTLIQRIVEDNEESPSTGLFDGWNLCQAGDVDGDGQVDLAVAAPSYTVSVHSVIDGSTLLRRDYSYEYMRSEGSSLGAVGDLNGDGRADLLIGANETGLDCDSGEVSILSGANGSVLYKYHPAEVRGEGCPLGVDAAPLGDIDTDGLVDIVVYIPRADRVEILAGAGLRPVLQRSTAGLRR